MKKYIASLCAVLLIVSLLSACSAKTITTNAPDTVTEVATVATSTTQATETEASVVDRLDEISNDVTKLWNEVFIEARDYAAHGTSCTGEPLDIDFVMSTMDKYYDKVVEDKAYIDTLGDEYSDIKLAFDKLYEKAEIIYNNLKAETPVANTPLSYADEIDLFQQYHTYFYDAVNELKYGN